MADGVNLEIVSPERLLLSQRVQQVTVPGTEGYFTVLGEHAPLMSTLRPGFITVLDQAGVSHVYFVRGGFADVSPEGLTILAEEAKPVAEFSPSHIEALIAAGMSALEAAKTDEEEQRLRADLDDLRNFLLEAGTANTTAH
jgi:F-type H+-transporting ATPase subunit epsilon